MLLSLTEVTLMNEKGFLEIILVALVLFCIVAVFASFIIGLDNFHKDRFSKSILPEDAIVNTLREDIEYETEKLQEKGQILIDRYNRAQLSAVQKKRESETIDQRLNELTERLNSKPEIAE